MLTTKELGRQILHILVGLVVAFLFYVDLLTPFAVFLLIVVGVAASLICKYSWLPGFSFFLRHFERDHMKNTFPGRGLVYFFVGVLLAMELFSKDIALAAIMILALGDSVSHIVGGRFGKLSNLFNGKSKKLLEGTVAGTLAGFVGAVVFVSYAEALLAAFVAMVAEAVDIELNGAMIDDNIVVPLAAGATIHLVRLFL